jgi:dopamine beta-monooxygenase
MQDFSLPDNVGLPFGAGGTTGLRMEMHYNNPSHTPNTGNRSGGRLTFTSKLREHDAAPLLVGDPMLALMDVPIGKGWSQWDFNCPGSCTETYLVDQQHEITVFSNMLHMHMAGERMVFKHYDQQGVQMRTEFVDNYEFAQAGGYRVPQKPFQVKPGDSFDVICYYNEGTFCDNRTFGLGSNEEMCIVALWYYPRLPDFAGICGAEIDELAPGCSGNYTYTKLEDASEIGRTFGTTSNVCVADENTGAVIGTAPSSYAAPSRLSKVSFTAALVFAMLACLGIYNSVQKKRKFEQLTQLE